MKLIDIGVNLSNSRFADVDRVVAEAAAAGVQQLIAIGTNLQESECVAKLTQAHPSVFATAGCHPHDAKNFQPEDLQQLQHLLAQPKVVAVGECGLDYNRDFSPREVQRQVFEQQLQLAVEIKKPVYLHQRDAHHDEIALLRKYRDQLVGGVIHCFTDGPEQLKDYLELDLHVGITGWVCDARRNEQLLQALPLIPDDRLLLETDAPYLLPRDLRPKPKSSRNEPRYLPHIAKTLAQLRGTSLQDLAEQTRRNSQRLFGL